MRIENNHIFSDLKSNHYLICWLKCIFNACFSPQHTISTNGVTNNMDATQKISKKRKLYVKIFGTLKKKVYALLIFNISI